MREATLPLRRAVFLLSLALLHAPAGRAQPAPTPELYRLRIPNAAGAPVEIRGPDGQAWRPLGKVARPATAAASGSAALAVVPPGRVAGVFPDALLIRLPGGPGYRALRVAASGARDPAAIETDLPPRGALFRCVAPPIGSRVALERGDRGEAPLPDGYVPRPGDRLLVIVAAPPAADPPSVVLENRAGGDVVFTATGGVPKRIARVKKPLQGIGRYGGTERAGNGRIVAWSPTAVIVSTASTARRAGPDGEPIEERGGFVIQPAEPPLKGATHPASQLILAATEENGQRPPLSPFFGLPAPVSSGDPLDPLPTRVEVRIDGGDWEPMPDLRGPIEEGKLPEALGAALGGRSVKTGITHLRILFGGATAESLARRILLATTPASEGVQRGRAVITAQVAGEGIAILCFYLNGKLVKLTNQPPYTWEWDTRTVPNGEHLIEIRALDAKNIPISSVLTRVTVDN